MANQNLNESMNKAAKWSANMMIDRKSGIPVDSNSIKTSLDALKAYSTNSDDVSYPGEIVSVVGNGETLNTTPNNNVEFGAYIIDGEGNPHKLGFDDKAINIEKGQGIQAVQQIPDLTTVSNGSFAFEGENPNAEAIDSSFKNPQPHGAIGNYSVSFNGKSSAQGKRSLAEGSTTVARGNYSHAEGNNSVTLGANSHAEGKMTVSKGENSHAEGRNTQAIGEHSHSEGESTIATGWAAHAEGYGVTATGNRSHVEGDIEISDTATYKRKILINNTEKTFEPAAIGSTSHREGRNTIANGNFSHAEGTGVIAYGNSSHAEGYNTDAIGDYSHAEGRDVRAIGARSHAEGDNEANASNYKRKASNNVTVDCDAKGAFSHREGRNTTSYGNGSHAEGDGAIAYGAMSHAEGYNTDAIGEKSHAEGDSSIANGVGSHAEGYNTKAIGVNAHAEGYLTEARGNHSHAEGDIESKADNYQRTTSMGNKTSPGATGPVSHIEGRNTEGRGSFSHAEGNGTFAYGHGSHAEGYNTDAIGNYSHAEGKYNYAGKESSHAEGSNTEAKGESSHAEGYNTTAAGNYSHAEGDGTYASGEASHASGIGTIASSEAQTVVGKYNNENSDALFIVGKGTSSSLRSNAFSVGKNNIYLYNHKFPNHSTSFIKTKTINISLPWSIFTGEGTGGYKYSGIKMDVVYYTLDAGLSPYTHKPSNEYVYIGIAPRILSASITDAVWTATTGTSPSTYYKDQLKIRSFSPCDIKYTSEDSEGNKYADETVYAISFNNITHDSYLPGVGSTYKGTVTITIDIAYI